jgi:hypothetical protein
MIRFALLILLAAAAPLGAQARGQGTTDIPPGDRPPPGMCRIWLNGVPASRQPAPTDCATAIRRRPPNARVIFGDEVRQLRRDKGVERGREKEKGKQGTPLRDSAERRAPGAEDERVEE